MKSREERVGDRNGGVVGRLKSLEDKEGVEEKRLESLWDRKGETTRES